MASVLLQWMPSLRYGRRANLSCTCHSERSEESHALTTEILRFAQNDAGSGCTGFLLPLTPYLYCIIGISTPSCSNIPAMPPPETCSTRMNAIVSPLRAYSQCSSGSKTELFVAGMGGNPSSKI